VRETGQYVTTEIAGEPIVFVRGSDDECAVLQRLSSSRRSSDDRSGRTTRPQLRCPYHGWTYSLSGELKGMPDSTASATLNRAENGLAPVESQPGRSGYLLDSIRSKTLSLDDQVFTRRISWDDLCAQTSSGV